METYKKLKFVLFLMIGLSSSAQVSSSFTLPGSVCLDENITFDNQSINAITYEWDFCEGDLSSLPTTTQIATLSGGANFPSVEVVKDGANWYAFLPSFAGQELLRLDFGTDLTNTSPTVVDLGNPGGLFIGSYGIEIINESGNWYGLVTNLGDSKLILLDFGTDIENTPTGTEVTITPSSPLSGPRGISVVNDNGNWYALVANLNGMGAAILDFGSSITNSPSGTSLATGNLSLGSALTYDEGNWSGYIVNTSVVHLDFGNSLDNAPTISTVTLDMPVTNGTNFFIEKDAGDYVGLLGSRTGNLYHLDLGTDLSANSATVTNHTNLGSFSDLIGLGGVKDSSNYFYFGISWGSASMYRIDFSNDCSGTISYSQEENPTGLSYSSSGMYHVTLKATGSSGLNSYSTEQIQTTTDQAPDVAISVDGNLCVSNSNDFSIMNLSGDIASYSWDFTNDGVEDSDLENPTYQFPTTGTHTVSVLVQNTAGCSNSASIDITIYPDPPAPDFDWTGSLCTNNSIQFNNLTDQTGYGDVIEWIWDFDGEAQSAEESPQYTFNSEGLKTISLTAVVPDCSSSPEQKQFSIIVGPSVGFTYTNNCFGEGIRFTNETTGSNIIGYSWDFGDSSPLDLNETPADHTYLSAGLYTVALTATNISGCQSTFTQDIEVSDQPLATITHSSAVENIEVVFSGMDNTGADDVINSWLWDFDGLGTSSIQNPTFVFSTPGTYTVALDVTTSQGCSDFILTNVVVETALYPSTSFTIPPQNCLNEEVDFLNESVNATGYQWDFCEGDLLNTPSASQIATLTGGANFPSIEVVNDGTNWYVFITSFVGNELLRLDFGSDLTNTSPTVVSLGNITDLLNGPYGLEIISESGNWYGLVTNLGDSKLILLDFDASLTNAPAATEISINPVSPMNGPRGISVANDGENLYALVANLNGPGAAILDFGNSITNTPTGSELSTGNLSLGSMIVFDEGTWSGYIVNSSVVHLDFGSSLTNNPIITNVTLDNPITNGTNFFIEKDAGNYIGLLGSRSGNLYHLDFGTNLSSNSATVTDHTNLGSFTDLIGLGGVKDSSNYFYYGITWGTTFLYRINFPNICDGSLSYSEEENPSGLSYGISGSHSATLKATGSTGLSSFQTRQIQITTDNVPDVAMDISSNRCFSNTNNFGVINTSGGVVSYSWDFNEDGIEDSDIENPTHQFLSTGTHTIRLDINDGTCNNFTEQQITIYPDPPTPTFIAVTDECKDTAITFTNTTDESQHVGVITYEWDFSGEGISVAANPDYSFSTPGTKQITLKTIIPGCENTSSVFEIEISDGPLSAFTSSSLSICEGESISFTDQSTNGPISWFWDFNDGFTSSNQSPNHLFFNPGNYDVALTVTDALGCQNTLSQEVSVSSLPEVSFDFDVPCTSSEGIQFMDLSTVNGASIVSRTWYLGDTPLTEAQNEQNPLLSFPTEGTVNVRLEIESSNGCDATHSEDIQILPAPQPDFSVDIGCEGEISSFSDISTSPGNQVTNWLWTLDGTTYTTQDINHTFSGAGMFDVTLEVTGQNFCSETITKSIEVLEFLTVDFEVGGDCSNELIRLSDQSIELADPIVSREWFLDGATVGNGPELILESLADNTYEIQLAITTASGCVISGTENLQIHVAPQSSISTPKTFGVPNDAITFTNESTGGSSYHWLFNGVLVSDNAVEETFVFTDAGTYEIGLVSNNDLGCSDTTITNVLIAVPNVDLAVGQFEIVSNDNIGTIFLEILNNSNLPIDNTEVLIELENQFSVTEQIPTLIEAGESALVSLNVGIPLNSSQLSYLCVSLNSQYKGFDDRSPLDNEKCVAIEPQVVVEAPFPNPVRDQVRVRLVTPDEGVATITLLNSAGKVELVENPQTEEGLNNFFLDMKALTTGIYFIRIRVAGTTTVQRIIKL